MSSLTLDLDALDPNSFEHMVNLLALRVLGLGHTGFGPGSDGGRDGYFEGEAPYPSSQTRWRGVWYIQSKFHRPHLSQDPQKWLLSRIKEELELFGQPGSHRKWPTNWIVATNIDPSGAPMSGAFDKARALVSKANPKLRKHFHIWGGRKILDLLEFHPEVATTYRHYLTPGHVLSSLLDKLTDDRATAETIIRFFLLRQFEAQQFTKLEQAGSAADVRPGIHRLFIDLPFRAEGYAVDNPITSYLIKASSWCQRIDSKEFETSAWTWWRRHPARARVWFVRGGPGQGKSTVGQYFCQLQRAALILQEDSLSTLPRQRSLAQEIKEIAEPAGLWPQHPRIPITVELKDFAQWFGQRGHGLAKGVLTYIAERITSGVEQTVLAGTLKRLLKNREWFILFDGLDEVPHDVKEPVAAEVRNFIDHVAAETEANMLVLCTSRPQGYSGEFSDLDGPTIDLTPLSPQEALLCAKPVIELSRSPDEAEKAVEILKAAMKADSVRELMTTPLQSHIMAVVVRDGGRPPDRRWQLYSNFYQVILRREADRDLPDKHLARLLREDKNLLKSLHSRLGFLLHSRAETSQGAQTNLGRDELQILVDESTRLMKDDPIQQTVSTLMETTTDRLVLVSTPDDGNHVRFDIRPLQEFFAAEFLYDSVTAEILRARLEILAGDSHWREVMHFLLSSLVENNRQTELAVALNVLEYLNEGNGEPEDRILSRKLARGAILSAKLLKEGVLDQDKRVRQQFRGCIEPLATSAQFRAIQLLAQVSQTSSQTWLINLLVDKIFEASHSENMGAALVLVCLMKEVHPRFREVRLFLLSAPPNYVSHLLIQIHIASGVNSAGTARQQVQSWFGDLCLEWLLREDWLLLEPDAVGAAVYFLRASPSTLKHAAELGIPRNEVKFLSSVLDAHKEHLNDLTRVVKDYGIIKLYQLRAGQDQVWRNFSKVSTISEQGFLGFLMRISSLHFSARPFDLRQILKVIDDHPAALRLVPSGLRSVLLLEFGSTPSGWLKALGDEQLRSMMLDRKQQGDTRWVFGEAEGVEIRQWQDLVDEYPFMAFSLATHLLSGTVSALLSQEEFEHCLLARLVKDDTLLLRVSGSWGRLLRSNAASKFKLREHIVHLARGAYSTLKEGRESFSVEVSSFELSLPSDGPLLPYISDALVDWASNLEPTSKLKLFQKKVAQFVQRPSALEQIIEDSAEELQVRAGALVLYLFHEKKAGRKARAFIDKDGLLLRFWEADLGSWFARAVRDHFLLSTSEEDPIARAAIGWLLGHTRGDFSRLAYLEDVLESWRERSHAPVQRAQVERRWLGNQE
jgi:hypothetical protein